MQKILAWVGVLSICAYIFKIDLNPFLSLLKLPGFNLPGNQQQQQQQQTPPTENQVPQTPQAPQALPVPQASGNGPNPKNQWGIGFKGGITTPFGSTKNEVNLGNPDFTDDENSERE